METPSSPEDQSTRSTPESLVNKTPGSKRRINIIVPQSFYVELTSMAHDMGRSVGETVRWMFGLSKLIWDEYKDGNRIVVKTKDGEFVKEILYPR